MRILLAATAALACGVAALPVQAATTVLLDDFNRAFTNASATGLGADWTRAGNRGGAGITANGNEIVATGGTNAEMIYTGPVAHTNDYIGFDFTLGTATPNVGAVLGWTANATFGTAYYVTLIQQIVRVNNQSVTRTGYVFKYDNYTVAGTPTYFTDNFTTGHFELSMVGQVATLVITPTGQAARTITNTFAQARTGDGIGIIFNGSGTYIDNVVGRAAAVPEPQSWAMMIIGFGLVGGTLRRRTSVRFA